MCVLAIASSFHSVGFNYIGPTFAFTNHTQMKSYAKNNSHLAGLEPATFRLTAERANQLRHKCLLTTYGLSIILGQYLGHRAKLT